MVAKLPRAAGLVLGVSRGGDRFRSAGRRRTLDCGTPPPTASGAEAPSSGLRRAMGVKNENFIVPSWDGAGGAYAKEQYIQEATAYVLGTR